MHCYACFHLHQVRNVSSIISHVLEKKTLGVLQAQCQRVVIVFETVSEMGYFLYRLGHSNLITCLTSFF